MLEVLDSYADAQERVEGDCEDGGDEVKEQGAPDAVDDCNGHGGTTYAKLAEDVVVVVVVAGWYRRNLFSAEAAVVLIGGTVVMTTRGISFFHGGRIVLVDGGTKAKAKTKAKAVSANCAADGMEDCEDGIDAKLVEDVVVVIVVAVGRMCRILLLLLLPLG